MFLPLERGNNKVLKALGEDGSCHFGIDIFLFSVDCSAFFESLVDDIDGFGGDAIFAHAGTQSHLPEEGYGFFYGFVGFLVGIADTPPYSSISIASFSFFCSLSMVSSAGNTTASVSAWSKP